MMNDAMKIRQTTASLILQYEAQKKSYVVAYALLIFLGGLGLHRSYADAHISGMTMFFILIGSFFWLFIYGSFNGFLILSIWCLVDLVLLHKLVTKYNAVLADKMLKKVN